MSRVSFVAVFGRAAALARAYTSRMDGHFDVVVDGAGNLTRVEVGDLSQVPHGVVSIAGGLVADRIAHSSFTWMPAESKKACQVTVRVVHMPSNDERSAYVRGEWIDDLPFGLTNREFDVATLVAFGMSSNSIAEQLDMSPRTVTTHVDRVMRKMGVTSRTAAAAVAVDQGLIRLPFPSGDNDVLSLLRIGRSIRDRATPADAAPPLVLHPLVIGAAVPLHGLASADGIEMVRATQLAIEELNERGGIDGRRVELKVANIDLFDGSQVQRAFDELTESGVDVLTSGYLARQDIAHEAAAESGIPYLHAATLDAVTRRVEQEPERYGRIFQVCASDLNYAPRFVEMLTQLRDRKQWRPSSNRLVVVEGGWDQTNLGLESAFMLAEQHGWVLDIIRTGLEPDAWSRTADAIRRDEPAGALLGNYLVEDTTRFLESFLREPSQTLLYSLYAPSVPEFRAGLGPKANGLLWSTVTGTYSDPHARAFVSRYRERYGQNPGRSHAGIAYDRVGLIARAWSSVSDPRNADAVSGELRQLIHRGVNGVYYFGDPTQAALSYPSETVDPSLAQAHLVFQIQQGRQRIIDPHPYADAEFELPWWLSR